MQHVNGFLSLVNEAKQYINEIDILNVKQLLDTKTDFYLIDVREDHEWQSGHIPLANGVAKIH